MSLLVLLAALCAIAYLPLTARAVSGIRSLVKTLSVVFLALAAAFGGGPTGLVSALGLCALGDLLLSRGTDQTFKAGIAAFGLGHLVYVGLFLTRPDADSVWLINAPQIWIALVVLLVVLLGASFLLRGAGVLRFPALGYIPIVLAMAYTTLGLSDEERFWALPAAFAIVLSDLVIALEAFVLPRDHWALRFTPYVIWPLYWGAQASFVIAFV